MANPFDFNEVEAKRTFEKSVIFGVSLHDASYVQSREFMKSSLAAANMLHDDDEENISYLTVVSSTSVG